jgi:hypothetical protein
MLNGWPILFRQKYGNKSGLSQVSFHTNRYGFPQRRR